MPGTQDLKPAWSTAAREDLIRLRGFLEHYDSDAALRSAEAIKKGTRPLLEHPAIGTRLEDRQDRELYVPFGARGYILRYRLHENTIVVLRVWHGREDR